MVAAASGLGCLKVFFACLAPTHGAAGNLRQVGEINAQRGFFDRRLDGYLLNRRHGDRQGIERLRRTFKRLAVPFIIYAVSICGIVPQIRYFQLNHGLVQLAPELSDIAPGVILNGESAFVYRLVGGDCSYQLD